MKYSTIILLFVFQGAGAQLYENYFGSIDGSNSIMGTEWRAQSFTTGTVSPNETHRIDSIGVYAYRESVGSDEMIFEIKAVDGSGHPSGSALNTSGNINITGWTTSAAWHYIAMSAYTLQPSTQYAIVIHTADAAGMRWVTDVSSSSYAGGVFLYSSNSGSTWSAGENYDFLFRIYGTAVVSIDQIFPYDKKYQSGQKIQFFATKYGSGSALNIYDTHYGSDFEMASADYEFDSTYVLAIRQEAYIPEGVINDDYVGEFKKNITWMSGNNIFYTEESDPLNAFTITKIDNNYARVTISDATKINGKRISQDTTVYYIVKTTDAILGYELDTFAIHISEAAYDHYIDYSYGGTESTGGAVRSQPRNDIDDLTLTAGHKYWLKRGSIITGENTTIDNTVSTETNPMIFGAYDIGNRPKFSGGGSGSSPNTCFYIGLRAETTWSRWIVFSDIEIRNYASAAIFTTRPSYGLRLNNLVLNNNNINDVEGVICFNTSDYADSTSVMPYYIQNCTFDTCSFGPDLYPDGAPVWGIYYIKMSAGPLYLYNNSFNPTTKVSEGNLVVRITNGQGGYVKHNIINGGSTSLAGWNSAIQFRGKYFWFIDNRILGHYNGIYIIGNTEYYSQPDGVWMRNNLFRGQLGRGVNFAPASTSYWTSVDNLFEDNLFDGMPIAFRLRDVGETTIRRNIFQNGSTGVMITETESSRNINFYYNLVYGFGGTEISFTLGTGFNIYNNTIDGDINCTGATSVVARNNFYRTITGVGTNTNYLDLDGLTLTNYFNDYTNNNWTLKSTATGAIDQGYHLGLTPDIQGVSVGNPPDIGAYEYQP